MKSRLSVSLSLKSVQFIERYKKDNNVATASETIERALDLPERQDLFDMFTQMGNDVQLEDAVAMGKETAKDIFNDSKIYFEI